LGARAIVTSTSDAKLAQAIELGATAGVNVRTEGWAKHVQALGPIDCIVDSVGGETINDLTSIIRPGGRIVVYGATLGHVPMFNMSKMFWKQIHLVGSTMGTPSEFEDMVQLVETSRLTPAVDSVFPLADAERAFDRMIAAEQFGKIVLRCN
jgi:NADPH:quinone reductase-like Zn-dependent oxidoreductase